MKHAAPPSARMRIEDLIDGYAPYVYAILSRVAANAPPEDIEEAASDALLAIWNARKRIDWASDAHRAYIAAVARNAGLQLRKRLGRRPDTVPLEEDWVEYDAPGPDEVAVRREQSRTVADALRSLDPPDPDIFLRRYYFGDSVQDIADALHMSARAVEGRLYRGRQRLKAMLEGGNEV